MSNGDGGKFLRFWAEVSQTFVGTKWFKYDKGGPFRKWYGNREYYINWENDGEEIKNNPKSAVRNSDYFFHPHFSWTLVGSGNISLRYFNEGFILDTASNCLYFDKDSMNWKILALLNSPISMLILKIINPTINNSCGVIGNIPFIQGDINEHLIHSNIKISELDWDAHETSWDFQVNELIRLLNRQKNETYTYNNTLKAIMLVYQTEWEEKFHRLHANEEELNRQFIEIYGLQDELTPDVPLDEVTILQKGEISIEDGEIVWHEDVIIKQLISYLVGCFMGRYSIDRPGLIIASQHQDLNTLGLKVEGLDNASEGRLEIDDDGIVPILDGEYFSDDMTVRIEQGIKTIFGASHFNENIKYINEKLGKTIREYLFKDFFNDHIDGKMYQKRPIYWLFSSKMGDKRKKGYFKALVYMHRMESDTLSKLHADYVVPFIDKIEQQHIEAEDLSLRDDLSQAQRNRARKSAEEYADQIRELKDFEQVLVQMASQRLSIDLDDGVRVNYPKFYPLVEPIKGLDKE